MNLFELTKEWRELLELLEEANEDPTIAAADLEAAFKQIDQERNKKLEACCAVLHNLETEIDGYSKQIQRLSALKKNRVTGYERLKEWVQKNLQPGEKFNCAIGGFSWKESKFLDSLPDAKIPKGFERIEPDKRGITAAIEGGKKFKGWFLNKRMNLLVK